MSAILAAGHSCSGAPEHVGRYWVVDAERRLHLLDTRTRGVRPEQEHGLKLSIPGTAPVLTCDAHGLITLLADGTAWRLNAQQNQRPHWRPAMEERPMAASRKDSEPVIIAAGSGCGVLWYCDRERRLWSWQPAGRNAIGDSPVPGDANIAAVDVGHMSVLLTSGERYTWVGGGWVELPGALTAAASLATLRVRMTAGVCLPAPHGDVFEGDTLELPEREARALITSRRAVAVPVAAEPVA